MSDEEISSQIQDRITHLEKLNGIQEILRKKSSIIKNVILVYETIDDEIEYCKYGSEATTIGLLKITEQMILNPIIDDVEEEYF